MNVIKYLRQWTEKVWRFVLAHSLGDFSPCPIGLISCPLRKDNMSWLGVHAQQSSSLPGQDRREETGYQNPFKGHALSQGQDFQWMNACWSQRNHPGNKVEWEGKKPEPMEEGKRPQTFWGESRRDLMVANGKEERFDYPHTHSLKGRGRIQGFYWTWKIKLRQGVLESEHRLLTSIWEISY